MARDYRTLKLEILAETKQFVANMKDGEKQVESFGDKATKMGKIAAAAFAAAAAAAVAYAGKLAIEGVKAAIEDEAAQNRLALALENVTGATKQQIAAVEDQITQMSLAYGVADDQLRPAFQRLATATGSLTEANDGLNLALDIAAARNISVEKAAGILAKAYEGNLASVSRLGVGMSTADLKALGLEGTMALLAETFGGAATRQANTLEGQIERLKIMFDETKESVGAALLPTIQKLMDYFVNVFIPKVVEAKDKALDPIKRAFAENEDAMRALWNFGRQYLVPFFESTLFNAIEGVGKVVGGVITIIGKVTAGIEKLVNSAITLINKLLSAWNRIPDFLRPGGKVDLIDAVDFTPSQGQASDAARYQAAYGRSPGDALTQMEKQIGSVAYSEWRTWQRKTGNDVPMTNSYEEQLALYQRSFEMFQSSRSGGTPARTSVPSVPTPITKTAAVEGTSLGTSFAPNAFRLGEAIGMGQYTINVNAPSIIDEEGFARVMVDALNRAQNRTGGGGGKIEMATL